MSNNLFPSNNKLMTTQKNLTQSIYILFLVMGVTLLLLYIRSRNHWLLALFAVSFLMLSLYLKFIYHSTKERYQIISTQSKLLSPLPSCNENQVIQTEGIPSKPNYWCYNPSLTRINGTTHVCFRKSSFGKCGGCPQSDVSYTTNLNLTVIGKLDEDLGIDQDSLVTLFLPQNRKIYLTSPYKKMVNKCPLWGIEDLRMLYDPARNIIRCSGNYISCGNIFFRPCMYYCELEVGTYKVLKEMLLAPDFNFDLERWEKNWVMVLQGESLYFVYNLSPDFIIIEPDFETGWCRMVKKQSYTGMGYKLRGSSPLFQMENGDYLGVCHTAQYEHLFYIVNKSLELVSISPVFKLDNNIAIPIQFACGLVIQNNQVVVTYGEMDCISKIIAYGLEEVLDSLIPLTHIQQQPVEKQDLARLTES